MSLAEGGRDVVGMPPDATRPRNHGKTIRGCGASLSATGELQLHGFVLSRVRAIAGDAGLDELEDGLGAL